MQNLKITVDICSNKGIKEENAIYMGSPGFPVRDFQRSYVYFRKLPRIVAQIDDLKKELKALKATNKEY